MIFWFCYTRLFQLKDLTKNPSTFLYMFEIKYLRIMKSTRKVKTIRMFAWHSRSCRLCELLNGEAWTLLRAGRKKLSIIEATLLFKVKDLMNETFWLSSVQLCGKKRLIMSTFTFVWCYFIPLRVFVKYKSFLRTQDLYTILTDLFWYSQTSSSLKQRMKILIRVASYITISLRLRNSWKAKNEFKITALS